MNLRGTLAAAVLFLLSILLIGCGGNGTDTTKQSTFAGTYYGTWTYSLGDDYGHSTITIDPSGAIKGTIHDSFTNQDGTIKGSVRDDGSMKITMKYPDTDPVTITGTMSWNLSSHLIGFSYSGYGFDWMHQTN